MLTNLAHSEILLFDRSNLLGGVSGVCRLGSGNRGRETFLTEKGAGIEACSFRTEPGQALEALVSDREVSLCVDDFLSATYDRDSGALKSASFSLCRAIIQAEDRGLTMPDDLVPRAWRTLAKGGDLTVVVRFDPKEERIAVIRKNESVSCLEALALPMDMMESYEINEDGEEVDYFYEEEDEEVRGELLSAWRCPIMGGLGEFAVGIRTTMLDFVIYGANRDDFILFHVRGVMDFSCLIRDSIDGRMLLDLTQTAFWEMDSDESLD